jgi:hypothetical protein
VAEWQCNNAGQGGDACLHGDGRWQLRVSLMAGSAACRCWMLMGTSERFIAVGDDE